MSSHSRLPASRQPRSAINHLRRHTLAAMASLAAGLAWPGGPLLAQQSPSSTGWQPQGPVQLINGFSAGGAGDSLCRVLAEALQPLLGQPVVVETRPGANGFIGAQAVSRSAPDGRTIGMATMSMLTISPQLPGLTLPIDTRKDLTPIATLADIYSMLVSSPDAPFRTVQELIEYARQHPGRISYASAGIGSAPHLAGELFRRQAGIDIVHVPYKGGAQAMVDLQAGRVQMLIGNMPDFMGQVKTGALRGIAFGGDEAAPALPDVPLIKQWLPEYSFSNWFGIVGPAGMPPDVVRGLNAAIQQALSEPKVRTQIAALGAQVVTGDTAAFQALIERDRARWGEIIRDANIRIE